MNKVILTGWIQKDLELRTTTNGKSILKFVLGVKRGTQTEEGKDVYDYPSIVAFDKLAETIDSYCKKNSKILIEGRYQTGSYVDENGEKRYTTDVYAEKMEFLEGRKKEEERNEVEEKAEKKPDPFEEFGNEIEITDDDLPF